MKIPVAVVIVAVLVVGFLGGIAVPGNLREKLALPPLAEASNQYLTIESSPQTVQISPFSNPNALTLVSPPRQSSSDSFTVEINGPLGIELLKRTERKVELGGEEIVSRYAISNVSDKPWGVMFSIDGSVKVAESPGKTVSVALTIDWLDEQNENFEPKKSVANIPPHSTREVEVHVAPSEDFQGLITFTVTISRVLPNPPKTAQR